MVDTLIREGQSFQSTPLVPVPQYWNGSSYEKVQGTTGSMYVTVKSGTVTVTGTVTSSGTASVTGTVSISSGTVTVTGNVTASGTVAVSSGTVTVAAGTVSVTGSVTASGTVAISSGTVTVAAGTVSVTGTVTASGTVTVSAGTVTSNIATVPVVGAQANAWNAASVSAGGTSSAVDCQYQRTVSAFGNVSAATTISFYVSQDNTNFYDSGESKVLSGSGNFHLSFTTAARYVRLQSSSAATITATIAGK